MSTATPPLPELALSVRQPWGWAIIHAQKVIENRTRAAIRAGRMKPGPIAIHVGQGMTRAEYRDARAFMMALGIVCPPPAELPRGGIIGCVDVIDIVDHHDSPWFVGPCGLVLANPRPCAFIPAKGELGYFPWQPLDPPVVAEPAPWMARYEREGEPISVAP